MDFIFDAVQKLKNKYLTSNPVEIMQQEGITVRYCYVFNQLKGYYCISDGYRYAGINGNMDSRMRKVVEAHELGHDILHRHIAESGPLQDVMLYSAMSATEREANEFAANLLITDNEMLEQVMAGYDYFALSSIFQFPLEIVQYKLNSMRERGHKLNILDRPDSQFLK